MGRPKTALLVLLMVQITLAVVAGGRAWAGRDDDPQLPDSMRSASSSQLPLTIESGVALANEQANAWLPDAYLLNASMDIAWPTNQPESTVTSLPPGGWVTVTYVAPWSDDQAEAATLAMFFERGSGQMYGQWQTEWSNAPAPKIAMPQDGIDSTTAVLAAELAGGTEFRAECPQERSRTRVNLTSESGSESLGDTRLVWLITYTNNRNQHLGYRVIVDVETGDILRIEDDRLDCSG